MLVDVVTSLLLGLIHQVDDEGLSFGRCLRGLFEHQVDDLRVCIGFKFRFGRRVSSRPKRLPSYDVDVPAQDHVMIYGGKRKGKTRSGSLVEELKSFDGLGKPFILGPRETIHLSLTLLPTQKVSIEI